MMDKSSATIVVFGRTTCGMKQSCMFSYAAIDSNGNRLVEGPITELPSLIYEVTGIPYRTKFVLEILCICGNLREEARLELYLPAEGKSILPWLFRTFIQAIAFNYGIMLDIVKKESTYLNEYFIPFLRGAAPLCESHSSCSVCPRLYK